MKKKKSSVSNKVPKNQITRFRANKGLIPQFGSSASWQSEVFSIYELPPIPPPSSALTKLLLKYNSLSKIRCQYLPCKDQVKIKRATGRINGFLAFRVFYSKSIQSTAFQRELSILLGKIWFEEENKAIWKRLADAYNLDEQNSKLEFFDWICMKFSNIN